jgi:hypothetical protein
MKWFEIALWLVWNRTNSWKRIDIGSDLTLQKATEIARLHEQFTTQARKISGEDKSVHAVWHKSQPKQPKCKQPTKPNKAFSSSNSKQQQQKPSHNSAKQQQQQIGDCSHCGYMHSPSSCPAKGNTCNKCGRLGHFAKMSHKKCEHSRCNNSDSKELFLESIDSHQHFS